MVVYLLFQAFLRLIPGTSNTSIFQWLAISWMMPHLWHTWKWGTHQIFIHSLNKNYLNLHGKQLLLLIPINFTPKTSHSCLKEIVLSYVFQVVILSSFFGMVGGNVTLWKGWILGTLQGSGKSTNRSFLVNHRGGWYLLNVFCVGWCVFPESQPPF